MNIQEFIKKLDIKTFVEIGAHKGEDTRFFKQIHPNARIVAFEPDPRNLNSLYDSRIDKLVELYPYALSDTNGASDFYLSSGDPETRPRIGFQQKQEWCASSSLKKPTSTMFQMFRWLKFSTKVSVKTVRLDDFEPLKDTVIDFIWADVQGAEDLVFSGAKETLKRTRYVYTEFCNTQIYENELNLNQILELFGPDWKVLHLYPSDVLLENTTLQVLE